MQERARRPIVEAALSIRLSHKTSTFYFDVAFFRINVAPLNGGVMPLLRLLPLVIVFAGPRALHAQPANNCNLKPERHTAYPLLTVEAQKRTLQARDNLCRRWIEPAPRDSLARRSYLAASAMDGFIMRNGYCRDALPNPTVLQKWEGSPAFKAVKLVVQKYCTDTNHPNSDEVERTRWLRTEVFCQQTRYFVDPAGWRNIFKPKTPGWKKFEEESLTLCQQLRSRQLSHDEAYYRFDQAWIYTSANLKRELGQRAAGNVVGTLKGAIEFVPTVVGLLPK